jgi:hypothetical protein
MNTGNDPAKVLWDHYVTSEMFTDSFAESYLYMQYAMMIKQLISVNKKGRCRLYRRYVQISASPTPTSLEEAKTKMKIGRRGEKKKKKNDYRYLERDSVI